MSPLAAELERIAEKYPDLMTPDQFAKMTGTCKKTVQNHISLGHLPIIRVLGAVRIVKNLALDQCLKRGQPGRVRMGRVNRYV